MIKKKQVLSLIEWIDSYTIDGWRGIEMLSKPEHNVCISVGWIVRETKQSVMIAPHISDIYNKECMGMACGIMTIPKVAIIKRIALTPPILTKGE